MLQRDVLRLRKNIILFDAWLEKARGFEESEDKHRFMGVLEKHKETALSNIQELQLHPYRSFGRLAHSCYCSNLEFLQDIYGLIFAQILRVKRAGNKFGKLPQNFFLNLKLRDFFFKICDSFNGFFSFHKFLKSSCKPNYYSALQTTPISKFDGIRHLPSCQH